MIITNHLILSWFFIPAWMIQPLTALVFIGTAWLAQDVLNKFVDSNTQKQQRYVQNDDYNTKIRKNQQKDPNKKIGFPIPFPNDPKDDDNPDKKDKQDASADKKADNTPDPNNDDAPKVTFKRIIPPNPDPDPDPPDAPIQTPPSVPISVKNPPYFKRTGTFIYQPLEQYKVNMWSMPTVTFGDSDFSPLVTAQSTASKGAEYMEFLKDSRVSNQIGKYKISDLLPVIMPPAGIIDANPTLIVGSEAIGKLTEAYENYSDGYLSNPIWFVPSEIQVNQINGLTGKKRRLPPELDDNFKPVNQVLPEIILDQNLFKIPKEVTMEQVLEFAGYCATFEGGAEKWEEYKKDPNMLNNPKLYTVIWRIPTSDQILNETVTDDQPKYQKQKLKIESVNEQLLVIAGTMYVKIGLHEFPSQELPGVKEVQPIPETDPNDPNQPDQTDKSKTGVIVGSLAAGLSYMANWFNFKIGDFPAEVEVPDPYATPTTDNPTPTKKEQMDISKALQSLVAGTGIGLAIANFNMNTNVRNSAEIEAAKNSAQKAAECSCAALDSLGNRTQAKARCKPGAFNFTSAEGWSQMLSETKRCYTGVENDDPTTMKEMLQSILFGVNIIKGAFFKNQKEIENQEKVLKDLLEGRIDDDQLKDFIKKFNDQKTPLTQDYPVKAKIVKKDTTQTQGGTQ